MMSKGNSQPKGHFDTFLGFDTETSGLFFSSENDNPAYNKDTKQHYQIVSCGLIAVNFKTLEIVDKKYIEIKWNKESLWEQQAEEVHRLSKEYLDINGLSEEDALYEIGSFILDHFGTSSICTLGHNQVRFDIPFLQNLANRHGMNFNFGNRHIDTNTLGAVCWETFNSDDLFWKVGLPERRAHNALEDIEYTLETVKVTRNIFKYGLNNL